MARKKQNKVDDQKESMVVGATLRDEEELEKKKEEELLKDILEKWYRADTWFDANKRDEYDYCENASVSYLADKSNWVTMSTIFDPATEKAVRALQAKTLVTIFQNGKDFFDLKGVGPNDYDKAKKLKSLMKVIFDNMPGFVENLAVFNRQRLVYGTAVAKVIWDVQTTRIKGREYVNGEYKIVEKDVVTYKGPRVIALDMKEEFRIDPAATSIDGFYKFHRTWKSYSALVSSAEALGYKNVDKISKSITYQYTGGRRYVSLEDRPPTGDDLVEILEYWSADSSRVVTIANRSVIIKDQPNPFFHGKHPFVYAVFEKVDFKFYGRGVPMKVKPQQTWLNYLVNLHNESALRYVCGQYQVPEDFPLDKIKFVPGGVVRCDEPIKPLQPALTPVDSLALIKELRNEIEEVSGAHRIASGIGRVETHGSATEYVGTRAVLNELHMADIILLEEMGLINIVRLVYKLLLQCMDEPMWIQITEEEAPVMVTPEEIAIDVDFSPRLGKQIMSKTEIVSNLVMFLQTVGPVAVQMGISLKDLFMVLAKAMGIEQDIKFEEVPQQAGLPPVQPTVQEVSPAPVNSPSETSPAPEKNLPIARMGNYGGII